MSGALSVGSIRLKKNGVGLNSLLAFDFDHIKNIHGSTNTGAAAIIQADSDTSQGCLLIKVALTMWDDSLSGHKNGFSISCGALEKGQSFLSSFLWEI